MMRIVLAGLLVLISDATLPDEWFEGESLLVEPPDNDLYESYIREEPGWSSTMWVDLETQGDDTVTVNTLSGHRADLSAFRESQDQPGQRSCETFDSQLLDGSERNGYKSIFWATECQRGTTNIKSIQLAIQGRDSFYHVRKLWKREVSDSEYAQWSRVLAEVSLCDTRKKKKHPCPEGYEKVQ